MSADTKNEDLQELKLVLTGMDAGRPTKMVPGEDRSLEKMSVMAANVELRMVGHDWPAKGLTMVGMRRLDNVQECVERVLADGVPGDLIETGVWRGGVSILMRAVLKTHGATDRVVFAADSFEGLPPPDAATFPVDEGSRLYEWDYLAVPLETVRQNFEHFDLLDDQVRFVKGWFRDTLPPLAGHPWAIVRLDGDMYESTTVALESLYPSLSTGGFLIVDDYNIKRCRQAVDDYRAAHGIYEEIVPIDWAGAYWRKSGLDA